MDPFSKRLRKQRERSSLHARQLNKNALALLHRQLHELERRKQRHARVLTRSREALLQELTDSEEPEQEGLKKREDATRRSTVWMSPPKTDEQRQSVRLSPPAEQKRCPASRASSCADSEFTSSPSFSSGLVSLDLPLSFSRHHVGDGKNSQQICRFQALSPLSPCTYFPCSRPHSYHRLKVSDVPDVIPLLMDPESLQTGSPVTMRSSNSLSTCDPPSASCHPATDEKAGGNSTSLSRARQASSHVSPRTSINERLRGLRQLTREMREKNEEKRPRDWAVNYGDPVSRRLLRKPVVPVSDE